jgi:hypothetical protein
MMGRVGAAHEPPLRPHICEGSNELYGMLGNSGSGWTACATISRDHALPAEELLECRIDVILVIDAHTHKAFLILQPVIEYR